MDLYVALQGVLDKINETTTEARYQASDRDLLKSVLENQARLGEALLMLGGLLRGILAEDVEVQVMPKKGDTQH
jgi:hypothetical protein